MGQWTLNYYKPQKLDIPYFGERRFIGPRRFGDTTSYRLFVPSIKGPRGHKT